MNRGIALGARCIALAPSLLVGCGGPAGPPPKPPAPSVVEVPPSRVVEPQPEFVLSHRARERGIAIGDHYGILHDHARFEVDAGGRLIGRADSPYDLGDVVEVPKDAGGGVFFAGEALFRAPSFLGILTRVSNPGARAVSVTFGPSQALVLLSSGPTLALSLPDFREEPPNPAGAILAARSKNGLGGVIVAGGLELSTTDGGKTWSRVLGPPVPGPVAAHIDAPNDIEGREDGVYFFESARTLRVDGSGVVEINASRRTPEKKRLELLFDDVVARGAALEVDGEGTPTKAIAGIAGTIYTADLASGAVVETERGVLPAHMECETTRLASEILVLCAKDEDAVVFSGPIGGKITHERTFNTRGGFVRGADDALLFSSVCTGRTAKPGIACVRDSGKSSPAKWTEFDRHAELSDPASKEGVKLLTWIPSAWGPIMLLGGDDGGILDAATGARTHLDRARTSELEQLFDAKESPAVLDDRFAVDAQGSIRGFDAKGRGVHITSGGTAIEHAAYAFSSSAHAGRFSLATSAARALFVSTDWGESYAEVARAPSNTSVNRCSEVGCSLGPWIRLGWNKTTPKAGDPVPDEVIPTTAQAAPPAPPMLVCKAAGAPTRVELPSPENNAMFDFGASAFRLTNDESSFVAPISRRFGAPQNGAMESNSLRGMLRGTVPMVDGVVLTANIPAKFDRILVWAEPFDPKATRQKATVSLDALTVRAAASGFGTLDLTTSSDDITAMPIASEAGGLLLWSPTSPAVWARGSKATPMAGPISPPWSVAETKPDELAILTNDVDGETVLRLSTSSVQRLFTLPPPLETMAIDALGVDASGALAVLRLPSSDPPTALHPALLLQEGALPVALAPWSSLRPAEAPECAKGEGFRAVIVLPSAWIASDAGPDLQGPSTLRVRWSEQRICLEGVELPAPTVSFPSSALDSYLTARFGKERGAAQLTFGLGTEFRDPRTCELTSSTQPPPAAPSATPRK
ncbi:MAG: hypothetical protein U0414_04420 [Polyangiaceae bacterium]